MRTIDIGFWMFLAVLALAPGAPAAAQGVEYAPGYEPGAPRPEAADQTLGMAIMSASVNPNGTLALGAGAGQ